MFTTATSDIRCNFAANRLLQGLVAAYVAIWIWAAIAPVYRFDWFLENILTSLTIVALVATYRRFPLSDLSYVLVFVFLVLHAIGGHYTYSEVPAGFWVRDALDLSRNHYDRLVHFSFGLLIVYPLREVMLRVVTPNRLFASITALALALSFSSTFEIIEMVIALIVNPEAGQAYLGTQGDEFDAQKDMALANAGALVTLAVAGVVNAIRGVPLVIKKP